MTSNPWRAAYVAVGSNLADPRRQVLEAFERLAALEATRLEARSRLYLSRAVGPGRQPDYVNAAAGLLTRKTARELLEELLGVEKAMGRLRGERWAPRIIDLDLIWMTGKPIDEPGLTLPHPAAHERNFVLYPLCEIAPTLALPGRGRAGELKAAVGGDGLEAIDELKSPDGREAAR